MICGIPAVDAPYPPPIHNYLFPGTSRDLSYIPTTTQTLVSMHRSALKQGTRTAQEQTFTRQEERNAL